MFGYRREKLLAVLLAAGLLGAGAGAWAQAPDQGRPGAGGERKGSMRGMERLHKKLNLNPQQEGLWQKAQVASRDSFRKMREGAKDMHQKLRAEIEKPNADLKQFAQMREQMREQMRPQMQAARKQVRDAWFTVYDSLDANQKEQVRLAIIRGMDRMDHMMHRGGRHDGGPRGEYEGESGLG